jgi:histidine phosphotransferase ChpT
MSEVHPLLSATDTLSDSQDGDLAARVVSRICHDLVSPLGAIANGMELLMLSGLARSPESELISESIESANARIRFFRLAFGTASRQPVGRSEIAGTLRGLERGSRLTYDWTPVGDHPRDEVKAVFLLLLCLETAMPLGGRIYVARNGPAWEVVAESPRLRIDAASWDAIGPSRAPAPTSASLVQFTLLPSVLDPLALRLELSFETDRIVARLEPQLSSGG